MKTIYLFCLSSILLLGCKSTGSVSTSGHAGAKANYAIEVRIIGSNFMMGEVLKSFHDKMMVSFNTSNTGIFLSQKEIELKCENLSRMELQSILSELSQCPGIIELRQYRVNNN